MVDGDNCWIPAHRYLLHPLTLYIDKTGVDKQQKFTLEPLVATSSILSAASKRKPANWFVIGFIPCLDNGSSATRNVADPAAAMRDYHRSYPPCSSH